MLIHMIYFYLINIILASTYFKLFQENLEKKGKRGT